MPDTEVVMNLGAVTAYGLAKKNGFTGTEQEWLATLRGPQGIQGIQGNRGPEGPQGPAGNTPVRGDDYWTDADKQAIVNDVLSALPTWTGGSY